MRTIKIPIKHPVIVDRNILGGTPVIKGTRVPASLVLKLLKDGYSVNIITKEYPSLSEKKLTDFLNLISHSFDASSAKTL